MIGSRPLLSNMATIGWLGLQQLWQHSAPNLTQSAESFRLFAETISTYSWFDARHCLMTMVWCALLCQRSRVPRVMKSQTIHKSCSASRQVQFNLRYLERCHALRRPELWPFGLDRIVVPWITIDQLKGEQLFVSHSWIAINDLVSWY